MDVRITGLTPGPHGFHLVSVSALASVICGLVNLQYLSVFLSCVA